LVAVSDEIIGEIQKCFIFITADRMVINIKNINIKAVWVVETILILCMAVYVYLNGIPVM
jgi:hypothetical protein